MNNIVLNWSINDEFIVPAYISIASLRKQVTLPVIIHFEGVITPELVATFQNIGPQITVRPVQKYVQNSEFRSPHINNRYSRFDIAGNSSDKTMLLIDADTAFSEGVVQLIESINSEKRKHPEQPLLWGVVEYKQAADAWLYFKRTDKFGNQFITPELEKHAAYADIFGPDWKQLINSPQFNNGILAFHHCSALAQTWENYYSTGLTNPFVNPLDDQVPLAVAMASDNCRTISWPDANNSKGRVSGDFACFHPWAGIWKSELLNVADELSNLSDYATIASEFWYDIPESWRDEFILKNPRNPHHYRHISGFQNFNGVCTNIISSKENAHIVEVGTYNGRQSCFIAELAQLLGKDLTFDTIDTFENTGTSRSQTLSNLRKAGVADRINVIEEEALPASKSYQDESLDLILLYKDHEYESVMANLNCWYQKLVPGGIIAGVDYALPQRIGVKTKSAVLDFANMKKLPIITKGLKFTIQKPTHGIPFIFHFCWFNQGGTGTTKPFSYVHYLCLLSVVKLHETARFYFYCNYEIESEWFDRIKHKLNVIHVDPPTSIYGQPLKKVEHQSDIFRFQKLIQEGGIYLDLDVFCVKPFNDLLNNQFVMGIEEPSGLCNAVILSEPNARFLTTWLECYHPDCTDQGSGFDPDGWAEMSVHFPALLANRIKEHITVLRPTAFFYPVGTISQMELLFNGEGLDVHDMYCHHLWQSQSWELYLKDLAPADIMNKSGYFYRLVRTTLSKDQINGVPEGELKTLPI